MPYLIEAADGRPHLFLHVQPKGSRSRVAGLHGRRLKIVVSSPPVDGKANKEVVRFLAAVFGVAKNDVTIKSGLQSRKKTVVISSIAVPELRKIVEQFL